MSWIKTNFLWMMYRSGWATKKNQERILAIWITRDGFEQILAAAYTAKLQKSKSLSNDDIDVRLQWDPDHSPSYEKLPRRAIQLGLKGKVLEKFCHQWTVNIEDITQFVKEQHRVLQKGGEELLQMPSERVYTLQNPSIAAKIELDFHEETQGTPVVAFDMTGGFGSYDEEMHSPPQQQPATPTTALSHDKTSLWLLPGTVEEASSDSSDDEGKESGKDRSSDAQYFYPGYDNKSVCARPSPKVLRSQESAEEQPSSTQNQDNLSSVSSKDITYTPGMFTKTLFKENITTTESQDQISRYSEYPVNRDGSKSEVSLKATPQGARPQVEFLCSLSNQQTNTQAAAITSNTKVPRPAKQLVHPMAQLQRRQARLKEARDGSKVKTASQDARQSLLPLHHFCKILDNISTKK